ncbi:MAG: YbaK/EbsC family protein [Oscillospiraceae bacterium]|nr:YbaK/EbsC family protein [Oscillospiraceae bacterium]
MSIERARAHIAKFGMEDRIQLFEESSATVLLAAERLGVEPARIAKTLSFLTEDGPILILTAGDMKIDNPKYKAIFHTKAKMVPRDQVEPLIGHEVGGVCPFGVREGVKVYLDESLKRFSTVFPAAGTPESAIELSIPELEQVSGYERWIDVCKAAEG